MIVSFPLAIVILMTMMTMIMVVRMMMTVIDSFPFALMTTLVMTMMTMTLIISFLLAIFKLMTIENMIWFGENPFSVLPEPVKRYPTDLTRC